MEKIMVSIRYLVAAIAVVALLSGCVRDNARHPTRTVRFDYKADAHDWCSILPADIERDWKSADYEPVGVDQASLELANKLLEDRQYVEITREDYTRYTGKSPPAERVLLLMRCLAMPGSGKTDLSFHNTQNVCLLTNGILSKSEVIPVTKHPVVVAVPRKPATVYIQLSVAE